MMVEAQDALVPDSKLVNELGITAETLWRWDQDPAMHMPPKTKIRGKNYRSRTEIEAFKKRMLSKARTAGNQRVRLQQSA